MRTFTSTRVGRRTGQRDRIIIINLDNETSVNRVSHNLGKRDRRLPETLSGIKMEGNVAGAICSSLRKPSANEFCVADLHWFPRSVSRENKCTAALRFSEIILKVSFTFTVPCNYHLNVFFFSPENWAQDELRFGAYLLSNFDSANMRPNEF